MIVQHTVRATTSVRRVLQIQTTPAMQKKQNGRNTVVALMVPSEVPSKSPVQLQKRVEMVLALHQKAALQLTRPGQMKHALVLAPSVSLVFTIKQLP